MDRSKAIELLKQVLSEVTQLRTLRYDDPKFKLWRDKIENILEAAFGMDSWEYRRFAQAVTLYWGRSDAELQEAYNSYLDSYETALKSIIQKYELLGTETKPTAVAEITPKAFIVHGGKPGVLEKLREFVEALGIKPLIVEMLPSKGMTLADKVKKYQQEADCAIILATRGGIIDTKSGKQHPRLNVIDELSSFWEAFPERVIVLLEKGAELPSNKSGLTYEPFARQSMDRAFTAIVRELTAMKILRAVRPD